MCVDTGSKAHEKGAPARAAVRRDAIKEVREILFLLLSLVMFYHRGICEAHTPVMEYDGMFGFMSWIKWLQVKSHGTELRKNWPWGQTPTSQLLRGKRLLKTTILPLYFHLCFSDTAISPSLASLVILRTFWHFQSLKSTQLFPFKCHSNVIWIKFILARHKYHFTLYEVHYWWKLPPITQVLCRWSSWSHWAGTSQQCCQSHSLLLGSFRGA